MGTRMLLLILSLSVVPVTAAADWYDTPSNPATTTCGADADARAKALNDLCVKAATSMQQAEQGNPLCCPGDEGAPSSFRRSITSASCIPDKKVRNPILASIARKQVRVNDFAGAFATIKLINNCDEQARLRGHVLRAKVRADLRCERRGRTTNCQ